MQLYVTAALFVLVGAGIVLAWRVSRKYEARRQIERVAEIQERQLRAGNAAPRTLKELDEQLRNTGRRL